MLTNACILTPKAEAFFCSAKVVGKLSSTKALLAFGAYDAARSAAT
jgi:hypothetical protein